MNKSNNLDQVKAPELYVEIEALREQVSRTYSLSTGIVDKLQLLKKFNAFEPLDERKSPEGLLEHLASEKSSLRDTNLILQKCLDHLNELL